jgi:photosystem II stability/assembly factor-like uncharacterized protein
LVLTLYDHLNTIDMHSPTKGWATGVGGRDGNAFMLHYARRTWTEEWLPLWHFYPTVIKMSSESDGWVAGSDASGNGMILRKTGENWTDSPLPPGTAQITDLAMISPDEVWAVAASHLPYAPSRVMRYNKAKGTWATVLAAQAGATFFSITMLSPDEGWVTGSGEPGAQTSPMLWHYIMGTWQQVALDNPENADIEHISMLSPDEGWGIGSYPLPHQPQDQYARHGGAIWHYTSGQWQIVKNYSDGPMQLASMLGVQAVAPGEVWVLESDGIGGQLLHLSGGAWQMHPAPHDADLSGFAVGGPDEAWVVGDGGLILHYIGGHWLNYFA